MFGLFDRLFLKGIFEIFVLEVIKLVIEYLVVVFIVFVYRERYC